MSFPRLSFRTSAAKMVLVAGFSAVACNTPEAAESETIGTVSAALSTDDAAVNHLWDIYRDLEGARHQLESARQLVQPNSLREEIRLRMETARMQLERGREHIEIARVQRTEQAFVDAAFELNEGHDLLQAEGLLMAVLPIAELSQAQLELALLLGDSDLDVPSHVVLRAIPANLPEGMGYIGGTTAVPIDSSQTVDGCQVHSYRTEVFRYNLVSEEDLECPPEIRLRAIDVWSGAPIEEWNQSSVPLPLFNDFETAGGEFVCAYRDPNWSFQISDVSDPRCFTRDTPLLVLLMDFADTDMNSFLADAEAEWSKLVFGTQVAQGNHYWSEVFSDRFALQPVYETQGVANNGVVHVAISDNRPTSGRHIIEDQPWVPEALDLASSFVNFGAYDADGDGELDNNELSVLVVPHLSEFNTGGVGAQANINFDYAINGTGPVLQRFARTNHSYTSIGVNMHELGHHIFGLPHFVEPTEHGLMGQGAYAEDPVISMLSSDSHWGTRPTHLTAVSRFQAGTVAPETVSGTTTVQLNSILSGSYNVVGVPVQGGMLYLENRTREGYDQSIPFCSDHEGGVFMTEYLGVSGWPLQTVGIGERRDADSYEVLEQDFCEYYSQQGHNDSFSFGGFTFSNFSQSGSVMQLDIIDEGVTSVVDNYKFQWWVNDPVRVNYRVRHFERASTSSATIIDFANVPESAGVDGPFALWLNAFYNTGEVRNANGGATWSTSSDYLDVRVLNQGTDQTLINIWFEESETYTSTATINVEHSSGDYALTLINLPDVTAP